MLPSHEDGDPLRGRMKTAIRFAVAACATLLLVEGGFRLYWKAMDQVPPHPDPSLADEWEWARDHLGHGEARLTGQAEYDPELGWTVGPKFRGPGGQESRLPQARRAGVPRLVLVGDSFTRELGSLGPRLPGWEIVNLAVQGYGAGQILLRYQRDGAAYGGDVVVFGLYLRDYFRMFRSFRGYAKPTLALDTAGEIVVEGVPVIAPEVLYEAYRSGERRIGRVARPWFVDFARQRAALHDARAGIDPEGWRLMAAVLRRFARDVRADGSCPLLLIFPTRPEDYHGKVYEALDVRAQETAAAQGLPQLALAEALYAGIPPAAQLAAFAAGSGGHLSPLGRRKAARALQDAVLALDVDACRAGPSPSG